MSLMPTRYGNWAKKIIGFGLVPSIGVVAPVLALPVITRISGEQGWASIAIGQAIGAASAVVVQFGWGSVGPNEVAKASAARARHLFLVSSIMKLLLTIAVLPAALLATYLIVPVEFRLVSCLLCSAAVLTSFSSSWYFIGLGKPYQHVFLEVVPRTLCLLISVVVMTASRDPLSYGFISVVSEFLIMTVQVFLIGRRESGSRSTWQEVQLHFQDQWKLALSALVSQGYTRMAVPVVALVSFSSVAGFAAAERIQQMSRSAIRPFVNTLISHVSSGREEEFRRRAFLASRIVIALGCLGSLLVAFAVPLFAESIFHIRLSVLSGAALGLTIVAITGSMVSSLFYLVPLGKLDILSQSTITGSALAVPAIVMLTSSAGVEGALLAIAGIEWFVLVWQWISVRRVLRNRMIS